MKKAHKIHQSRRGGAESREFCKRLILLGILGMLLFSLPLQAHPSPTIKVQVFSKLPPPAAQRPQGRQKKIVELSLEEYVRGVLPSEMPENFPLEALKAQAVLARTYALSHLGRHREEGFDFCGLTHCQVYGGKPKRNEKLDAAVRGTRGMILSFEGRAAEALYHSTCGGHTSANQRVFGGRPLPYLQGVSDEKFCETSPHFTWEATLSLQQISQALHQNSHPPLGEILDLKPSDQEAAGRVFALALSGNRREELRTEEFLSWIGQALGWNLLKSNWFEVKIQNGEVAFQGHGLGHGVGLCQWGAKGMAEQGKKFNEILAHYFPGTRLLKN